MLISAVVKELIRANDFPLIFRDIAKFITQFVVEEIDENTSMEDLQKMMAVALVYRVLVCAYEVGHDCRLNCVKFLALSKCDEFLADLRLQYSEQD